MHRSYWRSFEGSFMAFDKLNVNRNYKNNFGLLPWKSRENGSCSCNKTIFNLDFQLITFPNRLQTLVPKLETKYENILLIPWGLYNRYQPDESWPKYLPEMVEVYSGNGVVFIKKTNTSLRVFFFLFCCSVFVACTWSYQKYLKSCKTLGEAKILQLL